MKNFQKILHNILSETSKIFWILFKVILPVVVIIRFLELMGAIPYLAKFLEPLTGFIGIDGSLGLVWMAAILVNIYAGMAAFASLQAIFDYSVAETTILGLLILIAHSLPIEVAIARQSRVSAIFNLLFRFINAIIAGKILNLIFIKYDLFSEKNISFLKAPSSTVSNIDWAILQIQNFLIIFLIIFSIITTINILKYLGIWQIIINILRAPLSYLGMSDKVANIILIGLTLGISFGGGFLIEESKKNNISKKDILLSLSFLSLCHSIIEDTILILLLGSHISGVLFFRFIYTVIIILLMRYILDTKYQKFILEKITYD
ncbi:MAG: hypothetical protein EVA57_04410 [alpha proteobacterium HIMB59]|nr:MAG: hypothetical protein EVA57_04410 [alpha proteobacterium HIMB59]|tara:strand:- start:595 stop:1551 length:957 start_codon:yes stop_codon:yes gene_type:complete